MTEWHQLGELWQSAHQRGERMLLFTVIDVVGSSYRKPGAHMLATAGGAIAGSVSAGCIEADLIARLDELFAGPLPQVLSYTNTNEDEFALNRGCNGDICIYVEELTAHKTNSLSVFANAEATRAAQVHSIEFGSRVFIERIPAPIRLFIFGSARDAEPVASTACAVGMQPILFKKNDLESLQSIEADARTAIVIMSHDFERDREALHAVVSRRFPYVGVMGPRYRTEEMLKGVSSENVEAKLHFPVGLNIGAEGASEIAVSIVAELIETFRRNVPKVATIILAAGEAKRFGSPKQLSQFQGKSLVRRMVLETLLNPLSHQTAVVVGANADLVEQELQGLPVAAVRNENWQSGIGSSVAAGIHWAKQNNYCGVIITACDQVLIRADHLASLISQDIAAAAYDGTNGIPCYFDKKYFDELSSLPPNSGAKKLLERYAAELRLIPIAEAATDIDYREQLHQLC